MRYLTVQMRGHIHYYGYLAQGILAIIAGNVFINPSSPPFYPEEPEERDQVCEHWQRIIATVLDYCREEGSGFDNNKATRILAKVHQRIFNRINSHLVREMKKLSLQSSMSHNK